MAARTLVEQPRRPAIVMLHHAPIICGIPCIDKYMFREPEALSAVVAKFPTVERVLCGHVHRSFQQIWANTMVCACPSTATQIALRLARDAAPASYSEPPSYLLHCWRPGHRDDYAPQLYRPI